MSPPPADADDGAATLAAAAQRHSLFDDLQGLVIGTLFVALGLVLLRHVNLLTGGTAGIALVLHYATGWPFGALFFVSGQ